VSIDMLERTWLMQDIPRYEVAALMQAAREEHYDDGELIWSPDRRAEYVALVTSDGDTGLDIVHGELEQTATFPSPDLSVRAGLRVAYSHWNILLRRARHGQLVGASTALVASPHGVNIVGHGAVTALLIPGAMLRELANRYPVMWCRALTHANEIVISMNKRLEVERYDGIPERIAYFARTLGDWVLTSPLRDLSAVLGAHRKSISRASRSR
jgi:hypothetical protein